jgi:hypothetical protein
MDFHLLGEIRDIEPIAANLAIRERKNLSNSGSGDVVGGNSREWRWCGSRTV